MGLTVGLLVTGLVSFVPMPYRLWGLIPSLIFIWVIGLMQVEQSERNREATDLRARQAQVEHLATVAERERIARDLHDLLGHSLTAVVMRAQLIGDLATTDPERVTVEATEIEQTARGALSEVRTDPDLAATEAAEIERTAREALAQVRRTVTGWRRGSLDAELEAAARTLGSVGVALTIHRSADLHLVGATEHELALAIRETMTNVARHARASTCVITVAADAGELRIVVADDGIGGNAPEGNGLTGLRERIAALGGRVQRSGTTGTTVTIAVPLRVAV
jgi:two-component system sensor histidine kinase DesK